MANETNSPAADEAATNDDESMVEAGANDTAEMAAEGDHLSGDNGAETSDGALEAEAPDSIEALDPIEALTAERDELKDQMLRALADTENMRRRTEREMANARKYGHTNFARDLVGAIDNLARAMEAIEAAKTDSDNGDAMQALMKGIELSWTEIQSVIEKHGVSQVNPVGEKFDYNLHQAMFEVPTDAHEPGMVVEVVQHGYVLHDRLLRPAMVGVSKAVAE